MVALRVGGWLDAARPSLMVIAARLRLFAARGQRDGLRFAAMALSSAQRLVLRMRARMAAPGTSDADAVTVAEQMPAPARPSGWARQRREMHGLVSATAACLGGLASAGLRSRTARFGAWATIRLGSGALGLALAASLVPALVEIAQSSVSDSGQPPQATTRREAGQAESLSATLARFEAGGTGSLGEWNRIQRPIAIFGLGAPEFASAPLRYEALRHSGGGRDDQLIYGQFAPAPSGEGKARLEQHLTLSFLREVSPARSLFLDLTTQGAQTGLAIERLRQPDAVMTKFGAVEAADATLVQGDTRRACLAFRHVSEHHAFRFAGWWCGADARPADRRQLACLIDKVSLLSAGEDKALRAVFTQAEKSRDPACTPPRMAQAGRKTNWLDADAPPPALRNNRQEPSRR